jgi:RNA 3'-terminal phosphate cyclase (ATP)
VLVIDGAFGEGGGQILRTSLTASLLTGTPFEIHSIRARRRRPGLLRQHLTAVRAAATIGRADVEGATLGSHRLAFRPGTVRAGSYRFSVGSAGSACLVLQTVLLPLVQAGTSKVTVEGGTHNEGAPPFEFLDLTFAPLLRRMGVAMELALERHGFFPMGGGAVTMAARGARWRPLSLLERGEVVAVRATALVSRLPVTIAERELAVVRRELGWSEDRLEAVAVDSPGPGNVVLLVVDCEHVTEVFTGFGRRGLPAEKVAAGAVAELRRYLDSGVPAGPHLADQLLLPLVLAGGRFVTAEPTDHFWTNVEVIRRFFGDVIDVAERPGGAVEVSRCE